MTEINPYWNAFITYIVPLLSVFATIWFLYTYLKMLPLLRFAKKAISQWGTMLEAKKRNEDITLTPAQKTGRTKLVNAIKEKVPFNLLKNHSEDEVIGLLSDEDLMKGIVFLGRTGKEVLDFVVGKVAHTNKEKKELGLENIPVMH